MAGEEKLLKDYSDSEKGAYLSAIASIATADRTATQEELQFLEALADSAELSPEQKEKVRHAALDEFGEDLKENLDVLKASDLRFSLLADLVAFAESDENYSEAEKNHVEKIAQYLNISQQQYQAINEFVHKASKAEVSEEQLQQPQSFLESLGMGNQFKNAGINTKSLSSGLLGMLGPMILGGLMSRALGGRGGGGGLGGMLGGGLGGMLGGGSTGGGMGGMLGGRGGGLGSLISMLSGGRGMSSTGGLFDKVLRGF